METFDISSIEKLISTVTKILPYIKTPMAIGLVGELGAGKTTFVTELCRQLGVKDQVCSPTYILQNEYKVKDMIIEHWDLYRTRIIPEEVLSPVPSKHLRIIEWSNLLPHEHETDIIIEFTMEPERTLTWKVKRN